MEQRLDTSGPHGFESLLGRQAECGALDAMVTAIRAGESRTLVLRGDAGVGKTALLDYAVESAAELRVHRVVGVESEMELAFAALHQLCAPGLDQPDRLDRLPGPQGDALRTVFGLSTGTPPDRLLVGLAVLGLLAQLAEERPLLCVVDDAQWLDRASAQVLEFVTRRLGAESVGMLFATRNRTGRSGGPPDLVVTGLATDDARALLDSVVRFGLDERVRDRIVTETGGNPLALIELPRGLDFDPAGRRLRAAGRALRCRDGSRTASWPGSGPCRTTPGC